MKQSVIRYLGGKQKQAPWITELFPDHDIYVEPFGGAANVLLAKKPCRVEVYNDLDSRVVNLFRVLRDPEQKRELQRLLRSTPYSREEYLSCYSPGVFDSVEEARRLVVKSFMGTSQNSFNEKSGFRKNSIKRDVCCAKAWKMYPEFLDEVQDRLRGCIIENRDAVEVMAYYDTPGTLHYVDPPYMMETRTKYGKYAFEYAPERHEELLKRVKLLKGMVVVSGYSCDLYNAALNGWYRYEKKSYAAFGGQRKEILWCTHASQPTLF